MSEIAHATEEVFQQMINRIHAGLQINDFVDEYHWSHLIVSSLEERIVLNYLNDRVDIDLIDQWYIDTSTNMCLFNTIYGIDTHEHMVSHLDNFLRKESSPLTKSSFTFIINFLTVKPNIFDGILKILEHDSNKCFIKYLFQKLIHVKQPENYLQLSSKYVFDPYDVFITECVIKFLPDLFTDKQLKNDTSLQTINEILKEGTYMFEEAGLSFRTEYINLIKMMYNIERSKFILALTSRIKNINVIEQFSEEIRSIITNKDTINLLLKCTIKFHNIVLLDYLLSHYGNLEYQIKWNLLCHFNNDLILQYFDGEVTQDKIDDVMRNLIYN